AWRYRDWVIAALNLDMSYDAFLSEQLAGDLLENEKSGSGHEPFVATGFLTVGLKLPVEANRINLALEVADGQLELTARAFLGLSLTCARCHDHPTDPITSRDYYAMAGIFTSTSSLAASADAGWRGPAQLLERSLATPEELKQVSEYETRLKELKEQLKE